MLLARRPSQLCQLAEAISRQTVWKIGQQPLRRTQVFVIKVEKLSCDRASPAVHQADEASLGPQPEACSQDGVPSTEVHRKKSSAIKHHKACQCHIAFEVS